MEKIELIYSEYKRLVERYDQLLDSSFADIKLYGVLGPLLIGSSSLLESEKWNIIKSPKELFAFLLLIIFVIAIIAFRDLLKQSYLQQLGYNIRKYEIYLRNNWLDNSEQIEYEIFTLRKSWLEKYYGITKIAYAGFLFVFCLTIAIIPTILLWNQDGRLAIIIAIITISLIVIHSLLSAIVFNKTNKYEVSWANNGEAENQTE
jgi:hypothetical protein